MQWFYLDGQRQQLETDDEGIRRLADSGELGPDALVWNDSLMEWTPLRRALSGTPAARARFDETGTEIHPYQAPLGSGKASASALAAILARHRGWLRFLGVLSLLGGFVLLPLLPAGAFEIWMGILLLQIASHAEAAQRTSSERRLIRALEKTALFLKANAVFWLVLLLALGMGSAALLTPSGAEFLTGALEELRKSLGGFRLPSFNFSP